MYTLPKYHIYEWVYKCSEKSENTRGDTKKEYRVENIEKFTFRFRFPLKNYAFRFRTIGI